MSTAAAPSTPPRPAQHPRSAPQRPDLERVPAELRQRPQWVTWKYEKGTKVPYGAKTGRKASSTDPATWATYEQATAARSRRHHAGVGYVFSADDPYTGIDLDDCIDDAGDVAPWAQTIVDAMQTYTEVSPSGTGLKMWVRGTIPRSVKTAQIEIYTQSRYFTVTGQQLTGTPDTIRDAGDDLTALYRQLRPETTPAAPVPFVRLSAAVDDGHARRYALGALEGEHQKMRDAGEGARHNQRYNSAHALAGLIPHITEEEITAAIAVNFGPDEAGARTTIADGIRTGREAPREIPPPREPIMQAAQQPQAGPDDLDDLDDLDEAALRERLRAVRAERDQLRRQAEQLRQEKDAYEREKAYTGYVLWHRDISAPTKVAMLAIRAPLLAGQEMADRHGVASVALPCGHAGDLTGRSKSSASKALDYLENIGYIEKDPITVLGPDGYPIQKMRVNLTPAFFDYAQLQIPTKEKKQGGARLGAGRKPKCTDPDCPPGTIHRKVTSRSVSYYCPIHGLIAEDVLPDLVEDYIADDLINFETGKEARDERPASVAEKCSAPADTHPATPAQPALINFETGEGATVFSPVSKLIKQPTAPAWKQVQAYKPTVAEAAGLPPGPALK